MTPMLDPLLVSAISDLLWPIILLVVLLLFRGEIKAMVSKISHAKIMGSELDFSVDDLRDSVSETIKQSDFAGIATRAIRDSDKADVREAIGSGTNVTGSTKDEPKLLPYSIRRPDILEIRSLLRQDPRSAVRRVSVELERSLRNLLVSEGKISVSAAPMSVEEMARMAEKEFSLPSAFSSNIRRFVNISNELSHKYVFVLDHAVAELGDIGIEILELIGRVPREIIYVETSGIPVYRDASFRDRLEKIEATYLLFAAQPGQTGANIIALTNRLNYYVPGKRVSSVWEQNCLDQDVYIRHPKTGELHTISVNRFFFVGDLIEDN